MIICTIDDNNGYDYDNSNNQVWHHKLRHDHPYHNYQSYSNYEPYQRQSFHESVSHIMENLESIYSGKVKYGDSISSSEVPYKFSEKKQLTAFLLSLFIFGAARIYCEHFVIGSIQLALLQMLLLLICAACIASFCYQDVFGSSNQNGQNTPTGNIRQLMLLSIFWVPLGLVVGIWWIHDIASFGMNHITDANGRQLQPW